ncbi:hypothetical protein D9611_002408 [Ephemerocybe angulata]|uniref:Uncharacterized protein n=1 Tax=Ephemerocybe angulata TaxID=980116 RepID=A0A8H5C2Y1_9AGAR|nr:hypothetical protein D9611_002408 [Tulosesus angulatus]
MDLPSTRELELEALVRQRDAQVAELNDEITRLRQYIANQPAPSATDLVTLPPPLMKLLLPHIKDASQKAESASSTVVTALTQRVKVLQDENDELYQVLKVKETGKLKEEVRGLRRVVHRLEGSLRESHQVVESLSTEVEKAYESLMAASKQIPTAPSHQHSSRSPRSSYQTPSGPSQPSNPNNNHNGISRSLPTGPRAHKKPRLSDPRQSPPPLQHPLPPNPRSNAPLPLPPHRPMQVGYSNSQNSSHSARVRNNESREAKTSASVAHHKTSSRPSKMDVDEDASSNRNERGKDRDRDERNRDTKSPTIDRERARDTQRNSGKDRERGDHDKEKIRDKDRGQKDRERGGGGRDNREKDLAQATASSGSGGRGPPPRRTGAFQGNMGRGGGHGGGQGRRNNPAPSNGVPTVDRSLAERMGL